MLNTRFFKTYATSSIEDGEERRGHTYHIEENQEKSGYAQHVLDSGHTKQLIILYTSYE
jgi:hypothetical protein